MKFLIETEDEPLKAVKTKDHSSERRTVFSSYGVIKIMVGPPGLEPGTNRL
jgi:hypothetical protein